MDKRELRFVFWPFEKGELAKLIKISKPFSDKGQWFIEAGYLSAATNKVKYVKHFIGDLHLLIVGANYIEGVRQDMPNWETVEILFSSIPEAKHSIKAHLIADKRNSRFDYYTFGISSNKVYYIIPLIEIVRAILAPDVFWLNQITSLDSIDTRVLREYDGQLLTLNFSPDVSTRYVKRDSKIMHAAWIFSNPKIYRLLDQIYHSIQKGAGVVFDFSFSELHVRARAETWKGKKYVREILSCRGKRLPCREVIVRHPGLINYTESNENNGAGKKRNKRITIDKSNSGDIALVSDFAAIPNVIDFELDDSIHSEYESFAKVKRMKIDKISEENNGQKHSLFGSSGNLRRTTADTGGIETLPQMEFETLVSEKLEGEFTDIHAVLQLMGKRDEVISIRYHIGELSRHFQYRSVCTLEDGITARRYFAAIIKLKHGKEVMMLEIQREKLALTTLMIKSGFSLKWEPICFKILKGLVKKSGAWPDISEAGIEALDFYRFKHTHVEIIQKEKRMFKCINPA